MKQAPNAIEPGQAIPPHCGAAIHLQHLRCSETRRPILETKATSTIEESNLWPRPFFLAWWSRAHSAVDVDPPFAQPGAWMASVTSVGLVSIKIGADSDSSRGLQRQQADNISKSGGYTSTASKRDPYGTTLKTKCAFPRLVAPTLAHAQEKRTRP